MMKSFSRLVALTCWLLLVCLNPVTAADPSPFDKWEKSIQAFEQQDEKTPHPKHEIVFVGSSSIRMWKLDQSFPELKALNRGFGGSQTADSLHFAERLVLKHEPRIVVLYAGDNDIAGKKTPEQVVADFKAFAELMHTKLPQSKLVYIAIKPSPSRWKMFDQQRAANAAIREYACCHDFVKFLDVVTPMLGDDGQPRAELFLKDNLHMTDAGYKLWNELLLPELTPPACCR